MKKKVLSAILVVVMMATMIMGCSTEEVPAEEGGDGNGNDAPKVGITIQSLKNDYWAGVMGKLEEILKEAGWQYTLVDCEDNAGTQIDQIKSFITDECDLIMVHPSDAASVESVCGEALAAGIKVMCWDDQMENTTVNWVLDNTTLGAEIGKAAAAFINEHYTADNPAKVVTIGYPSTKVLLERENGIKAGLQEACDEGVYEIVASVEGLETNEALVSCETALSFNPDATVFVGVGAGAMLGADEALLQKYGGAGNIPENVGVITADVTMRQLEGLKAGDQAIRAIVGFEGSNSDTAAACFSMFNRIIAGEDFLAEKNIFRPTQAITADNIDEIMVGM